MIDHLAGLRVLKGYQDATKYLKELSEYELLTNASLIIGELSRRHARGCKEGGSNEMPVVNGENNDNPQIVAQLTNLKDILKDIPEKKSKRDKATKVKSFIEGGIVYGPNNDLKGEYQGIENNPEVIAPLNKLKELIKDAVRNQPVDLSKSIPAEKLMINRNRGDKD